MTRITILFSNTETRAVRWVGWRLFDTKEHIVFPKKKLSFFLKDTLQNSKMYEYKNIYLTSAKTESFSTNFVKSFGT